LSDSESHSWLKTADALGRGLETLFLTCLFLTLLALAVSQIVLRNVFSSGLSWADELVRLLVLWLAVLGAVAASRDRRHIAIEVVVRSISASWRRVVVGAVSLFASSISGIFAWQSWRFVQDTMTFGDVVLGSWPAWVAQLILPVGFGLIAYRYLLHAARQFQGRP
jgi:TRAP-type C4-dicarboxylate transport system permease small subunit